MPHQYLIATIKDQIQYKLQTFNINLSTVSVHNTDSLNKNRPVTWIKKPSLNDYVHLLLMM